MPFGILILLVLGVCFWLRYRASRKHAQQHAAILAAKQEPQKTLPDALRELLSSIRMLLVTQGNSLTILAQSLTQNRGWSTAGMIGPNLTDLGKSLDRDVLKYALDTQPAIEETASELGFVISIIEDACIEMGQHRQEWNRNYDRKLLEAVVVMYDGELSRAVAVFRQHAGTRLPIVRCLRDILLGSQNQAPSSTLTN